MNRSHPQMVTDLKKPGQDVLDSLTPALASAAHMLTGVYDEHLELLDEIESISKVPQGSAEYMEVRKLLANEAGDLIFYLEGLHQDIMNQDIDLDCVKQVCEEYERYSYGQPMEDSVDLLRAWIINVTTPIKRRIYYGKEINEIHWQIQVEGTLGILSKILQLHGLSLEDAKQFNQEKLLGGRYKEGKFSNEQANTRKDEESLDTSNTKN